MTLTLYGHRPDLGLCLAQQVKETVSRPFRFLLRVVCLLLLSLSLWQSARANDIKLNSVSVATGSILNGGTSDATVAVTIGLSWNNSWRTSFGPANWDAAWVFIKYRVGTTDPQLTGITTSSATFTVASTLWLRVGMPVSVTSGTGAFASGTVITAVNTSTRQVTVSTPPTTALSNATITCYRIWEHAKLSDTGNTTAAGYTVDMGRQDPASGYNADNNPNLGAFIYRSSSYSGDNTNFNTTLRWNIGRGGQGAVDVRVFAIEMVYVPGGSFYVGDGTSTIVRGQFHQGGSVASPFQITSEAQLTLGGTAATNLANNDASGMDQDPANQGVVDDFNNTITQSLPATFPKGYNAFYCMKYEVTQAQYRDFLNCLTRTQQANRCATALGVGTTTVTNRYVMSNTSTLSAARMAIRCDAAIDANAPITFYCDLDGDDVGNESTDGEWICALFMAWSDACAYLDWAGLRPMTELEYEKACRGTLASVADEYAWGSTNATTLTGGGFTNSGMSSETAVPSNANIAYDNSKVLGPIRAGAFAGSATTREQAGATYYGIMEMSGNGLERTVSVGHPNGRSFTGTHGDGTLSTNGHANTTAWPTLINGEITLDNTGALSSAAGSGFRGGNWVTTLGHTRLSERVWANFFGKTSNSRLQGRSFRGIRSAP